MFYELSHVEHGLRIRTAIASNSPAAGFCGRLPERRITGTETGTLNTHRHLPHTALVLLASLATLACGDDVTGVAEVERETVLAVQPDAGLTANDPSGVVALSVRPAIVGGWLTVERCENRAGEPLAADPLLESCEAAGGRWAPARDASGTIWQGAAWRGADVLRFERFEEQAPSWMRAFYTAAPGSGHADVGDCRWILATGNDVGVLCSSSGDTRALPWTVR